MNPTVFHSVFWRILLFTTSYFITVPEVSGQDAYSTYSPVVLQYGDREDMPATGVYDIFVDEANRLWQATATGVYVYDGNTVTHFTEKDGLVSNRILRIGKQNDQIWFLAHDGRLCFYQDDRFHPYPHNQVLLDSASSKNALHHFGLAANGEILFTYRSGAHRMARLSSDGGFHYDTNKCNSPEITVHACSNGFLLSEKYQPYLNKAVNSELKNRFVFQAENGTQTVIPTGSHTQYNRKVRIPQAVKLNDGRLVVNTTYGLYAQLEPNGPMKEVSLERSTIRLMVDSDGWLWEGLYTGGINVYRPDDLFRPYLHLMDDLGANCLAEDKEGGIWNSCMNGGAFYVPNKKVLYRNYKKGSAAQTFLLQNGDRVENIRGKGLFVYRNGVLLESLGLPYCSANLPPNRSFLLIAASIGAYVYDPDTRQLSLVLESGPSAGFKSKEQSDSTLFVRTGTLLHEVGKQGLIKSTELGRYVRTGYLREDGTWLLAGPGGAFAMKDDNMERIYPLDSTRKVNVRDIFDHRGDIYLSTNGQGVVRISGDKVDNIDSKFGLRSDFVKSAFLIEDTLLVLSGKGVDILEVHPDLKIIGQWHPGNGWGKLGAYKGKQRGDSIIMIDIEGKYSVAVEDMIHHFPKLEPPRLLVKQAGVLLEPGRGSFTHEENEFSFHFSNGSFQQDKEYRYRLMGVDRDWQYTRQQMARYPDLDPGDHRFLVEARPVGAKWAGNVREWPFSIAPAFYQRWEFLLGALLVLLGMLVFLIRLWYERKRKRQEALFELVSLKGEALRSQMNPHFTFNALNSIQAFVSGNNPGKASHYLSSFASLIRMFLDFSREDSVSIHQEIELLRAYLDLEQMRFRERFTYTLEIDETLDLHGTEIPPILVQPLVENALVHGVLPSEHQVNLVIVFEMASHELLQCTVFDNGAGIKVAHPATEKRSVGMQVVKERLANFARAGVPGGHCSLSEGNFHGQHGTLSTIVIPILD